MAHLRASETVEERENRRKSIRFGMARLWTAETLQERGTRRKSNSLQMMQTRINETAQNREANVREMSHALQEWLFGKTKKMLSTPTTYQ
ncbi:hypothetical protein TNCT_481991 [Trichonephila clavata]|uniref:Uncharacterized protein n=1 Tax=Trichonephila clavata TaxID=2740835 RepID=A0A8X6JI73_TRICU|nr:hypothetical protein TNCT_481991 [Trichonephila clavata]